MLGFETFCHLPNCLIASNGLLTATEIITDINCILDAINGNIALQQDYNQQKYAQCMIVFPHHCHVHINKCVHCFSYILPQRISHRLSHAEQEMLTLLEHLISHLMGVCDVRMVIDLILYLCHTYLHVEVYMYLCPSILG